MVIDDITEPFLLAHITGLDFGRCEGGDEIPDRISGQIQVQQACGETTGEQQKSGHENEPGQRWFGPHASLAEQACEVKTGPGRQQKPGPEESGVGDEDGDTIGGEADISDAEELDHCGKFDQSDDEFHIIHPASTAGQFAQHPWKQGEDKEGGSESR